MIFVKRYIIFLITIIIIVIRKMGTDVWWTSFISSFFKYHNEKEPYDRNNAFV